MAVQGCDVVLNANSFHIPQKCASCGGAQQTTRSAKKTVKQGNWTTTRTFQIPYCGACAARAQATWMKGLLFAAITLGIAGALAGVAFLAAGLPAAVGIGLPIVVSLGFAVFAMTALAPKAPPAPATAKGEAVKLVKFSGSTSHLYCVNAQWGAEFAQMNGVQPLPKSRTMWFGAGTLGFALVAAPVMAAVAWFYGHPQVHVDNPGSASIQVYLDGKPKVVVKPDGNASMWVGHGKHTFGWSKEGESAPTSTIDADVTVNDAHLYNPGETGCYWLVADSYGHASVMGAQQGPQPVKEFYSFDKVDTWFGDNPQSISVDSHQRGGTRVALQRAKACMYLATHGCDPDDRNKFIECEKGATDDASFKKCEDEVSCGTVGKSEKSEKAESKPTASAAHTTGTHAAPAGHPAAHAGAASPAKPK